MGALAAGLAAAVTWLGGGAALAQAPDPGGDAEAAVSVPPPGKLFGLNGATRSADRDLSHEQLVELAAGTGANAIRGTLSWQEVEPTRGGSSDATWAPYDRFYRAAQDDGVTPILVLTSAPRWARELVGQLCLSQFCSYPPRRGMEGAWAAFAGEAARRYPQAIFEVWNEPNLAGYWQSGPDPEHYARLQVAAYDAIKAVNPDAVVLSAGFANVGRTGLLSSLLGRWNTRDFVRRAYLGPPSIKGHVDGLAIHPYPGSVIHGSAGPVPAMGAGTEFARAFDDIREVREEAGDSATPIFVTETAISTADGVTRSEQVAATRRIYRKTLTMGDVAGVVFHRLHAPDNVVLNGWEVGAAWTGSGPYPPPPWPVYCAFAADADRRYPGC